MRLIVTCKNEIIFNLTCSHSLNISEYHANDI